MNRLLLIGLLICFGCNLPKENINQRYLIKEDINYLEKEQKTGSRSIRSGECFQNEHYVPDTNHLDWYPVRYIRINFHWVNNSDTSKNYKGQEARDFIKMLLHSANKDLQTNNKLWFPYRNDINVIPPRLQYRLTPGTDEEGDDGIYFHNDDELCYYIHKGRTRNLFHRKIIQKYSVKKDSILNVFFMPHHPDSVASSSYLAGSVGVALGKAVKMAGMFEDGGPAWKFRGILNHEVGHVFGLAHAWLRNDGCDDTPPHPGKCWNKTEEPPCDTMATNNIMDYSAVQNAFTPCQIGKVHRSMATKNAPARALLEPTWCILKEDRPIIIQDSVVWQGAKDVERNIIIQSGASLSITCRISMPPESTITIQPGGHLILESNAQLHNDCGKKWKGILIQREGSLQGRVTSIGNAKIEDISNPLEGNF